MKTYRHEYILLLFAALGGCGADAGASAIETSAETKQALISTVVSASFTLNDSMTSIQTGEMPASWFASEVDMTQIYVSWHIPASSCRFAMSGSITSNDVGSLNAVLDSDGVIIGYSWSAQHDLTTLENHWHNHLDCTLGSMVSGCSDPRPVTYALIVGGACLTSNTPSCLANGGVSLPAVQDSDMADANCTAMCDAAIGACVSACQTRCTRADITCHRCCECACKDEIHSDSPACSAAQLNCYLDRGNIPACLPMPALPDVFASTDLNPP